MDFAEVLMENYVLAIEDRWPCFRCYVLFLGPQ